MAQHYSTLKKLSENCDQYVLKKLNVITLVFRMTSIIGKVDLITEFKKLRSLFSGQSFKENSKGSLFSEDAAYCQIIENFETTNNEGALFVCTLL